MSEVVVVFVGAFNEETRNGNSLVVFHDGGTECSDCTGLIQSHVVLTDDSLKLRICRIDRSCCASVIHA